MSNKEGVPGPGIYEAKSRMGEMPAFVMGGKLTLGGSMDVGNKYVPGPGTYTPQKSVYDPQHKYSMGLRTSNMTQMITQPDGSSKVYAQNKDPVPGPGSYNSKSAVKNLKGGYRMGSEKRVNSAMLMGVKNPGPNAYNSSTRSV